MSSESPRNQPESAARRPLRRVLLVVLALVVLIAGLSLYDYIRINLWIDRDAGRLEGYPVRLVENGKEVPRPTGDREAQINRLLIDKMRENDRNVVTLSRSEIKYNLLRTHAHVKLVLETALPDQPEPRSRLRVRQSLRRTGSGWQLTGEPVETTLE